MSEPLSVKEAERQVYKTILDPYGHVAQHYAQNSHEKLIQAACSVLRDEGNLTQNQALFSYVQLVRDARPEVKYSERYTVEGGWHRES